MLHVDGACQANRREYRNLLAQAKKSHALTRGEKTAVFASFRQQTARFVANSRVILSDVVRHGWQTGWKNRGRLLESS